jgi:hypothetical protein
MLNFKSLRNLKIAATTSKHNCDTVSKMERGSPCPSVLRPQGRRKGIHPEGEIKGEVIYPKSSPSFEKTEKKNLFKN